MFGDVVLLDRVQSSGGVYAWKKYLEVRGFGGRG
jgi:hypothetical protein